MEPLEGLGKRFGEDRAVEEDKKGGDGLVFHTTHVEQRKTSEIEVRSERETCRSVLAQPRHSFCLA